MRFSFVFFMLLTLAFSLSGFSGAEGSSDDQARGSKLLPLVGTWTCRDTGSSKPYSASVKIEGAWMVWRDTGEDASTIYLRYNPSMKAYVVANIVREGEVEVSTTEAADPLNATWHVQFPAHTSGPLFTLRQSGRIFSLARPYVRSGKRAVARLYCEKRIH